MKILLATILFSAYKDMLAGLVLYNVFSASPETNSAVITREDKIYIVKIDEQTKFDKMVFRRSFDRILNGQRSYLKVDGQPDAKGIIRAKVIEE